MQGNSYKYNIQLTYMKDDIEINLDYKNILMKKRICLHC